MNFAIRALDNLSASARPPRTSKTILSRTALILLATLVCTSACGNVKEVDKKRLPAISKSRPIGSPAGPSDSASIKRINFNPTGETGDWISPASNFVDPKRIKNVKTNSLMQYEGCVVGFVKFDKPGYLQQRIYDDVYGDIYAGWSAQKVQLKPSKNPVYVSVGLSYNRDDAVQEVCWFADGAKEGVVVFSTAYPDVGEKLTAADVYRPEQLGNEYQFHDTVAINAINANLKNGDIDRAQHILNDCVRVLSVMRDGQEGSSGKRLPAKVLNAQNWAMVRTYELGLALGEPDFKTKMKVLEEVLNGPHWPPTTADPTEREYRDMLPMYMWLNEQLTGKRTAPPKVDESKSCIAGHDPKTVTQYLQADKQLEDDRARIMFTNVEFWKAVKNFLRKDFKESENQLNKFFDDRHSKGDAFEVAAAAKLKDFEFFELHPEK